MMACFAAVFVNIVVIVNQARCCFLFTFVSVAFLVNVAVMSFKMTEERKLSDKRARETFKLEC